MTFDRMYPLPVAALPVRNLAEAHVSPALRLPYEPIAASYVAHIGDAVLLVSCTAVERVCVQGAMQWHSITAVVSSHTYLLCHCCICADFA